MTEKRIRHYVEDILVLDSRETRCKALSNVPGAIRDDVEYMVRDHYLKQASLKKHLEGVKQRGHYARQTGLSASDCPYQESKSPFRKVWMEGWNDENRNINQTLGRD